MEVTRETEAVMLLNVSFGKSEAAKAKPLTPVEWGEFAGWLKDQALGPGDLLNCNLANALEHWEHPKLTVERLHALLNRGAALGFALEKWQRAGLWVVTRSDADYPRRLKQHLQRTAPAILFGCGNRELLGASSIAVVGSRHAREADIGFAERIGRRAAECGEWSSPVVQRAWITPRCSGRSMPKGPLSAYWRRTFFGPRHRRSTANT